MAKYLSAFPDLHFTIEDLIAKGDTVAGRFTINAAPRGELLGIPTTNRQLTLTTTETFRLAAGRIED